MHKGINQQPHAVRSVTDRGDRHRQKSQPSEILREKSGAGENGGLTREGNKQRGEPTNNNANRRLMPIPVQRVASYRFKRVF